MQKLGNRAWDNPAYSGSPSPHGTLRICTISSVGLPRAQPKKPEDGPQEKIQGTLVSSCCLHICHSIRGLWGTTLTENTAENRELYVKTTLRELLVYTVFLLDICLWAGRRQLWSLRAQIPEKRVRMEGVVESQGRAYHPQAAGAASMKL
ncbi:Hypothetical predicted protein [Marmota monax]|nr:hypothetical protein GHT09_002259 [Marmota monax]VTJ72212.1 Hypothetical predicted protein [Marmota monax]